MPGPHRRMTNTKACTASSMPTQCNPIRPARECSSDRARVGAGTASAKESERRSLSLADAVPAPTRARSDEHSRAGRIGLHCVGIELAVHAFVFVIRRCGPGIYQAVLLQT